MEKLRKVSNPDLVLNQLKKQYGDDVDLYLSTFKNKKYMVFKEEGKKVNFESLLLKIIPNTKTSTEEIVLGTEIENGKMLISIHQHIYHIICYGKK